MSKHSDYPDDIREYDHDPRSPFYNGPVTDEEAAAALEALEIAGDMDYDRMKDERAEENNE